MHQQTGLPGFPGRRWRLAGDAKACPCDVISLPMHAYLDEPTQARIIKAVRGAIGVNDPEKWPPGFRKRSLRKQIFRLISPF